MCICIIDMYMQVNVPYRTSTKHYVITTPARKHMSKAVARSKKNIIEDCFSDDVCCGFLKKKVARRLKQEIKVMCSHTVGSVLQSKSKDANQAFQWSKLAKEMIEHAPLLTEILTPCDRWSVWFNF